MDRLIIQGKKLSDIFALADIEYGKSRGCYTDFHLVNGDRNTSSKPLAYYENLLAEQGYLLSFLIRVCLKIQTAIK
jgi:hypothetical protein